MSDSLYELPENCDFSKIKNATNHENECSPKLKDKFFSEFYGILINAPKEIVWPKDVSLEEFLVGPSGGTRGPLRFPLAGLTRIKYKDFGLKGQTSSHVLLVAVDQDTAKTYSGRMPKPNYVLSRQPVSGKPEVPRTEADKNALLNSYFNFDLVHDLGLPIADANYNVYATLGDLKSNVLSIRARVEK